jgi:hypothetical protein
MAYVNKKGYLERKTRTGTKNPHSKSSVRNWWMVKSSGTGYSVKLGKYGEISCLKKYAGKRVRFKIEEVKE